MTEPVRCNFVLFSVHIERASEINIILYIFKATRKSNIVLNILKIPIKNNIHCTVYIERTSKVHHCKIYITFKEQGKCPIVKYI